MAKKQKSLNMTEYEMTLNVLKKFKNYELIQADYSFEDFYNWYDYFVETESYCNVYRFY